MFIGFLHEGKGDEPSSAFVDRNLSKVKGNGVKSCQSYLAVGQRSQKSIKFKVLLTV